MRLIDADGITRDMIINYLGMRYAYVAEDVEDLIEDQPTQTQVGVWIKSRSNPELVICGHCMHCASAPTKYCSECGFEMCGDIV